jgi:ABC-type sulfate transport system permease subunit
VNAFPSCSSLYLSVALLILLLLLLNLIIILSLILVGSRFLSTGIEACSTHISEEDLLMILRELFLMNDRLICIALGLDVK